jgi:hypothetical protein
MLELIGDFLDRRMPNAGRLDPREFDWLAGMIEENGQRLPSPADHVLR